MGELQVGGFWVDDHCGEGQLTDVWETEYGSAEEGSANLLGCRPCTKAMAGSLTNGPRIGRLWVGRTKPSLGHSQRTRGPTIREWQLQTWFGNLGCSGERRGSLVKF